MSTVNFRCGNCGGLLAVGTQHLGQQVRCPHCQKVIVAPTSAAPPPPTVPVPPPPAPAPPLPPTLDTGFGFTPTIQREEVDSIFTSPTQSDDLFGQPSAPKLEIPTEVLHTPTFPAPAPMPMLEPASSAGPPADGDATLTFTPPSPAAAPGFAGDATIPHLETPAVTGGPAPMPWSPHTDAAPGTAPETLGAPTDEATAALLAKKRSRSGWYIPLFIVPLISYAILATILVVVLWMRLMNKEPHPYHFMPDVEGEYPIRKKEGKLEVPKTSLDLPKELRVALGKTLRLGELEVTPVEVKRGTVELRDVGKDNEAEPLKLEGALILRLELKNCSEDLAFHPMDRHFTRLWLAGKGTTREGLDYIRTSQEPYTYIEIGGKRFYGGPAAFLPPSVKRDRGKYQDEYIVGQKFETLVEPGETLRTFVCSDPGDEDLKKALRQAQEDDRRITWRVQVRRGTVKYEGRRIPGTAVIGVEFRGSDIKKES